MKTTKIKELKNLALEVQKASLFAEEVKAKITEDLKRLTELGTFVGEVKTTILALEEQVKGANDTLKKLDDLIS